GTIVQPDASTTSAAGPGSGSSPVAPIQRIRSASTSTLTPSRSAGPVPSARAASRNKVADMGLTLAYPGSARKRRRLSAQGGIRYEPNPFPISGGGV